ncbi:Taste receptor [Mactra antiquata]
MELRGFHITVMASLLMFSPLYAINIPGNFTIIGLFKIHEPSGDRCGTEINLESVMLAESVKWYIQQINTYAKLPFTIGFEAYETCQITGKASEATVNVLSRVLNNEKIVGLIGPEYSSETALVASMLGSAVEDRRLPQVGFSATATGLVDQKKYPSFVRVIPNDDVQVDVRL